MSTQHPITPPPELLLQWSKEKAFLGTTPFYIYIATRAAQWGADQELEACCHEVQDMYRDGSWLRNARRPKPPSLKEQALQLLKTYNTSGVMLTADQVDTIRRALNELPDN
jgi:hypothetical protein